jgi:magnesium chelatase family protein
VVLPAAFLLIATLKLCPCGECPNSVGEYLCPPDEIAQYKQPLKDVVHTCFDIEIEVSRDTSARAGEVLKMFPEDSSAVVRQRVEAAHLIQQKRYAGCMHLHRNVDLKDPKEVEHYCQMLSPAQDLLKSALRQLHLTPLQMQRLQVVARTIADLADSALIDGKHMAEAIRSLPCIIIECEE